MKAFKCKAGIKNKMHPIAIRLKIHIFANLKQLEKSNKTEYYGINQRKLSETASRLSIP